MLSSPSHLLLTVVQPGGSNHVVDGLCPNDSVMDLHNAVGEVLQIPPQSLTLVLGTTVLPREGGQTLQSVGLSSQIVVTAVRSAVKQLSDKEILDFFADDTPFCYMGHRGCHCGLFGDFPPRIHHKVITNGFEREASDIDNYSRADSWCSGAPGVPWYGWRRRKRDQEEDEVEQMPKKDPAEELLERMLREQVEEALKPLWFQTKVSMEIARLKKRKQQATRYNQMVKTDRKYMTKQYKLQLRRERVDRHFLDRKRCREVKKCRSFFETRRERKPCRQAWGLEDWGVFDDEVWTPA